MAGKYFLFIVVFPALVSGALLVVLGRLWRERESSRPLSARAGVLGLAMGYAASYAALRGWPSLPPTEALGWLVYVAMVAVFVGWIELIPLRHGWVRWVVRSGLTCVLLVCLLHPFLRRTWSLPAGLAILVALAVGFLASWASMSALLRRPQAAERPPRDTEPARGPSRGVPTWEFPWLLVALAAGSAVVLGMSGSVLLAQLAGAVASALGIQAVVLMVRPSEPWSVGIWPVAAVLLIGLWLAGFFYASLHPLSGGLLVVSLAAPWLGSLPVLRRIQVVPRMGWDLAGPVLCLIAAILVAYYTSPPLDF